MPVIKHFDGNCHVYIDRGAELGMAIDVTVNAKCHRLGVCNAADPADNEGLFAALPAIHEQLDEAGLAFVYRSVYPSGGAGDVAAATQPGIAAADRIDQNLAVTIGEGIMP